MASLGKVSKLGFPRSAPAALDGSGDASARRDLFAGEALAAPTDWHI